MNVNLLYPDREWNAPAYYYDYKNITQDLSLNSLFMVASKQLQYENGEVKRVTDPDLYIRDVMQKVVLSPLSNENEILYRQEIIKDFLVHEDYLKRIYEGVAKMLDGWDRLGRKVVGKNAGRDNATKLSIRIHEVILFAQYLTELKTTLREMAAGGLNTPGISSRGLKGLLATMEKCWSDEREAGIREILDNVYFYIHEGASEKTINRPRIVLECGVGDDGRLGDFRLADVSSVEKRYRSEKSAIVKIQNYFTMLSPNMISCKGDTKTANQARQIEYTVVKYLVDGCDEFYHEFEEFFDRLHFQMAFYTGAVTLTHHMKRFALPYCFPKVCDRDRIKFDDLKEFVMCLEQMVKPVGNTCSISPKNLIIITGANQGGKSTFLRSVGIAQVMLQCGLPVVANSFESGIFTHLFMHFTRREDSQMNSGRLDEELGRMNQIIDHLGPDSMILLNESFATTTERDGSIIAYDIIKALVEHGVKIITVTHLLSFAQRMYEEYAGGDAAEPAQEAASSTAEPAQEAASSTAEPAQEASATAAPVNVSAQEGVPLKIEFLCAERKSDGRRTFKMIQHVPELTSFGLDLYEKIIEKHGVK